MIDWGSPKCGGWYLLYVSEKVWLIFLVCILMNANWLSVYKEESFLKSLFNEFKIKGFFFDGTCVSSTLRLKEMKKFMYFRLDNILIANCSSKLYK